MHESISFMHDLAYAGKAKAPYPKFPKIPRLSRECIVTEKIDGTNGLVYVGEPVGDFNAHGSTSQVVRAGSRNRWLEPGKQDNYGFAGWVALHAGELRELGPGYHYGEWWGVGIGRGYDIFERRFSLFNVSKWTDDAVRPKCCRVVPIIQTIPRLDCSDFEGSLAILREHGSLAAPGFMRPEGIVVFHTQGRVLFKKTLENDEKGKEE